MKELFPKALKQKGITGAAGLNYSNVSTPHFVGDWRKRWSHWTGSRFQIPSLKQNKEGGFSIAPADPHVVTTLKAFSNGASIVSMLIGYHVLIGWIFDIEILKTMVTGFFTMNANVAVGLILAGMSLFLLQTKRLARSPQRNQLVGRVCAGIVTALGLVTLCEIVFGWNAGIDQLLFNEPAGALETPPGRMSPAIALLFILIGLALLLLDQETFRRHRPAGFLALTATVFSSLAVCGYIFGAEFLYYVPFYKGTAVHSAIAFLLLSLGILSARPDQGFMMKVSSDSFGGLMARRLLVGATVTSFVLGRLVYEGERRGLYDGAFGLALFAMANIIVFTALIWWSVNSLHRLDSKRRQAESEVKETAAKLSRSNADLEQFAYVASHDLQEPLRAISGSVQILQEQYVNDEQTREIVRHTVEGTTRMQNLIRDLLTYSRLTAQESPLQSCDSSRVLQQAMANLETSIHENKASISSEPLPVVRADPTQLAQVFQNLIGNGIKYRSARTPKIHIAAHERDNEWEFSIRDNGIGIAPQYTDRIFRIFQRLQTREGSSGTGIGLAVCKKVVERHGGRIWVESELEEGSTFFFTLHK